MMSSTLHKDYLVCKVTDLPENQMKEFEVAHEKKVLLVNNNGTFSAVSPKCTHYGAPLVKGELCKGRVRCPWHGACFSTTTGDIEDYPGLDSLFKFETYVKDGNVRIKASDAELTGGKRIKTLSRKDPKNNETILIIGGGAAGQTCAETLRQEGFTGNVVLATKECNSPYDRPKLSKMMDVDVKSILLRPKEFYESSDIQLLLNKEASEIDILKRKVGFKDGESLNYNKLLIATGGTPNVVNASGNQLKNVCTLRTPEDAFYIARASQGKDVVVVGSSFIGMEVASALVEKAKSVTVVSLEPLPFARTLGVKIGLAIRKLFEDNKILVLTERTVAKFKGEKGVLTEVVLDSGIALKADICVLGIGVRANTDFVNGSGITITKTGSIPVDEHMKTDVDNVYAAGDIAEFPLFLFPDKKLSIGHWQMAHAHGRVAALNMLNKPVEIKSVPYFWTVLMKKSLRFAGYSAGHDDIMYEGDVEALKFAAFYCKGMYVIAVCSMDMDPLVSKFAEVLYNGDRLPKRDLGRWLRPELVPEVE